MKLYLSFAFVVFGLNIKSFLAQGACPTTIYETEFIETPTIRKTIGSTINSVTTRTVMSTTIIASTITTSVTSVSTIISTVTSPPITTTLTSTIPQPALTTTTTLPPVTVSTTLTSTLDPSIIISTLTETPTSSVTSTVTETPPAVTLSATPPLETTPSTVIEIATLVIAPVATIISSVSGLTKTVINCHPHGFSHNPFLPPPPILFKLPPLPPHNDWSLGHRPPPWHVTKKPQQSFSSKTPSSMTKRSTKD